MHDLCSLHVVYARPMQYTVYAFLNPLPMKTQFKKQQFNTNHNKFNTNHDFIASNLIIKDTQSQFQNNSL